MSLSGQIGSDHLTHFSFSGEYNKEDKASPVILPVTPGNFIGRYRDYLGFLHVDRELNQKNNLFFRSDADAFYDTNPKGTVGGNNLPTVDRIFKRRTYSEELGETAVISPTLVNSARLQFQLASPITAFDPITDRTQFSVPISTGGTFTSGTSQSAWLANRQYQANDTLSAIWDGIRSGSARMRLSLIRAVTAKEFGGPILSGPSLFTTPAPKY